MLLVLRTVTLAHSTICNMAITEVEWVLIPNTPDTIRGFGESAYGDDPYGSPPDADGWNRTQWTEVES